jgi:SAM-dependent methyltransferase
MPKQVWPAPERNKLPILDVLRRVLPARGTVLEIGSGTGQHVAYFAEQLPGLVFQPSDLDPENLASVRAWVEDAKLPNLRLPFRLDVRAPNWGVDKVEAIFSANMLHIAPWECAEALFAGAGRHLAASGVCVVYGPFRVGGAHTAPSNAAFDADLRARDASFGVRDKEAIEELAERAGLALDESVVMPANNLSLVFRRN